MTTLHRRTFLGGAGAMIGLPLLEAMLPRRAHAAGAGVKRLVFFVFQGGTPDFYTYGTPIRPGCMRPATTGAGYALTPILAPLANVKDDCLVISNLSNAVSEARYVVDHYEPDDADHARSANGILSGHQSRNSGQPGTIAEITVDQIAAAALQQYTPALPSLMLEVTGYYASVPISWLSSSLPNYAIQKPSDVFRQVFGDVTVDTATAQRNLRYRKSLLHYANDDAARLRAKLGRTDQLKLDEYLTSVGELERRTQAASAACSSSTFSANDGADIPGRMQQMADLVKLAFQCDRTRVATVFLNLANSTCSWLGSPFGTLDWHGDIAHGAGVTSGAEREKRIDMYVDSCAWQMKQFGYLVEQLKNTPEGDGTGSLLDNTLLVCTSDMGYGDGHAMSNVACVLAGGGGRAATLGRHIEVPEQPIANLYLSMLQAAGIAAGTVGNSTSALTLT